MTTSSRFPFPLPYGWFSIGRLDDLPEEPVAPIHVFDEEPVLWCDDDGPSPRRRLVPPPRRGGRVEDGRLVCPIHEWSFDGDGTNVAIPSATGRARRRSWGLHPTMVGNRHLLVWHHPDPTVSRCGTSPSAWTRVRSTLPTASPCHSAGRVAEVGELTINGHLRRVRSSQAFQMGSGPIDGEIDSNRHGPAVGIVTFRF